MYSINFTENNKKFCLSLHGNEANSYLFVNCTKMRWLSNDQFKIYDTFFYIIDMVDVF